MQPQNSSQHVLTWNLSLFGLPSSPLHVSLAVWLVMILTAAFIQQPGEGVETHGLAGGHSSSAVIPHHLPFRFFRNMSASLWWLAVRMCCVFVLDLMPNLLSNNDCTGSVSDEKSKAKEEWALIPHCYSGTGSQQEPYEAAVRFWHFANVVSETCQSPWFNMAGCCSSSPGAYIRSVPVRGDVHYVCTFIIDFAVLESMFAYLK